MKVPAATRLIGVSIVGFGLGGVLGGALMAATESGLFGLAVLGLLGGAALALAAGWGVLLALGAGAAGYGGALVGYFAGWFAIMAGWEPPVGRLGLVGGLGGLAAGVALAGVHSGPRPFVHLALGGLVGGFVGGLLLEALAAGRPGPSADTALRVAAGALEGLALGACTGFGLGIAAARQAPMSSP